MAQRDPWFRYYVETPDDPKLDRAAMMAGCEYDTAFTAWTVMLTYAKKSPVPGVLLIAKNVPVTYYEIANKIRRPGQSELVKKISDAFAALDMVQVDSDTIKITHWEERQYKSDNSTPRWQKWKDGRKGDTHPGGGSSPPRGGSPASGQPPKQPESTADDKPVETGEEPGPADPSKPELSLVHDITGLYPDYLTEQTVIEKVRSAQRRKCQPVALFGQYLASVYGVWCNSKTTDGKPYNRANWAWLDWAVTGQADGQIAQVAAQVSKPTAAQMLAALEG